MNARSLESTAGPSSPSDDPMPIEVAASGELGAAGQPAVVKLSGADEPDANAVRRYLLYTLSLPERTLRSGAGMLGGAAREAGAMLLPRAFQDSQTYRVMVRQTLDFLVEDVGGVARGESASNAGAAPPVDNFVARKAIGNFVDSAGLLTFHISPLAVLAILSDVAYGSQTYLKELAAELKKQGVIAENSTIDHVDDLLSAVSAASKTAATAIDTPPVSLDGLKQTLADTRQAVARMDPTRLLPQSELQRIWDEMHQAARSNDVSLLTISGAMTMFALNRVGGVGRGALSSVKVAGNLFDRHVVDHYSQSLGEIRRHGLYATLAKVSGPYVDAVWNNFSGDRATVTEDVLTGRLWRRCWSTVCGLWKRTPTKTADAGEPIEATEPMEPAKAGEPSTSLESDSSTRQAD